MKYSDMAPEQLFKLARDGDGCAFEQIVLATEKGVYNLALSLLHNREDAEDVTQDTYLRLWRSLPEFRGDCSPQSWIYRIARNRSLDLIRRRRTHVTDSLTYEDDEDGQIREYDLPDTDTDSNPPESYIRHLETSAVRDAIAALPTAWREIIVMRDMNDMSYNDISDILSVPVGTVKSRLFRARATLAKILKERNIL